MSFSIKFNSNVDTSGISTIQLNRVNNLLSVIKFSSDVEEFEKNFHPKRLCLDLTGKETLNLHFVLHHSKIITSLAHVRVPGCFHCSPDSELERAFKCALVRFPEDRDDCTYISISVEVSVYV